MSNIHQEFKKTYSLKPDKLRVKLALLQFGGYDSIFSIKGVDFYKKQPFSEYLRLDFDQYLDKSCEILGLSYILEAIIKDCLNIENVDRYFFRSNGDLTFRDEVKDSKHKHISNKRLDILELIFLSQPYKARQFYVVGEYSNKENEKSISMAFSSVAKLFKIKDYDSTMVFAVMNMTLILLLLKINEVDCDQDWQKNKIISTILFYYKKEFSFFLERKILSEETGYALRYNIQKIIKI